MGPRYSPRTKTAQKQNASSFINKRFGTTGDCGSPALALVRTEARVWKRSVGSTSSFTAGSPNLVVTHCADGAYVPTEGCAQKSEKTTDRQSRSAGVLTFLLPKPAERSIDDSKLRNKQARVTMSD